MKTTSTLLLLLIAAPGLWAQTPPPAGAPASTNTPPAALRRRAAPDNLTALPSPAAAQPAPATSPAPGPSATDASPAAAAPEPEVPGIEFTFNGVDVNQVLDAYADLIGRTQLRVNGLPQGAITLKTHGKLTKTEAIEALQAVLAMNGIAVVNIAEKFVKEVPLDQFAAAAPDFDYSTANNLPKIGGAVTHIVQLKYVKPSEMIQVLQPLAKLNSLFAIDANGILVIRDLAENIQRMLQMIDKIDINVPAVYVSEVIPIRYAQAADIASALNGLGGSGGGATVNIGSSTAPAPINGTPRTAGGISGGLGASSTGMNGASPIGGASGLGVRSGVATSPNGTPGSPTTVQQRLMSILNRATGPAGGGEEGPIQLFGQAKIIADSRANSLLIYATRPDMDAITNIIAKLDVLLPAVLIEAVIIDYSLGPNAFNFGVSAAQNPKNYGGGLPVVGGGGYNNGPSLINNLSSLTPVPSSTASNIVSTFAGSLGSGFSYFGNIGPSWDVALQAISSDSHASIIQRPRIMAQQAKPAQFFVGETVPYITSFGNYGYGNQSSYSQLSVGVELDVTPYINPDGLVVMDVQQELDDIIPNGGVNINGTSVPSTTKRTLNSQIAVRDRDTVMLGGFIKNAKSTGRTGVPFLQNIPLLGSLFSQRNSSKQREELIVLMRPTVLKTPEIASTNTIMEGRRLPGISAAVAEDAEEQSKSVEAERKLELKHSQTMSGGFFNASMTTNAPSDQLPAQQYREDGLFMPVSPASPPVQTDSNTATPTTP